ncbi:MAG: PAS domain S-box protein [Desulfobacteraceae bacterium]
MAGESVRQEKDIPEAAAGCDAVALNCIQSFADFSRLWQLAFDATDDMISVMDLEHRIIAVNKAMANAMGCAPEEAVGQRCFNLLHKNETPPMACPHKALREDGQGHRSEIYDEGLDLWMLVSVTPLYDSDQQLVGSIHISRDITQQKRSEQAYRESEERYHHLSEATMEGVLLSEDSTIIAANRVLADMMGYSVDELIGMNMLQFISPNHRDRLVQSLRERHTGSQFFDCIRKDGTIFSIEAHSRAISYKGGMVFQTAIRDLTEQIRIEKERVQHERMRGVLEMAGAVCHEINQPLMALQGFVELLCSNRQLKEASEKHLHRIDEQVERIKSLTHKIMRITKYETKDYPGGEKIIDIDQSVPEDIE